MLWKYTQRVDLLFFWKWVKELDPFFGMWLKEYSRQIWLEWNFFLANITHRVELFLSMTQGIVFFQKKKLTETAQRIEHFFDMTQFFLFFKKTQRFFLKKELNSLKNKTWLKELRFFWVWLRYFFKKLTLRTEPFFECDSKKLNLFFQLYSKNWILFTTTQRIEHFFLTRLQELNPSIIRLKDFVLQLWLKNVFFLNMTQRIELFLYDSKLSTFVFKMTQIIKPFSIWL